MIDRAVWAVTSAALVAVTYTGKRGAAAFMWFCAVFGLPLAVFLWILLNYYSSGNPAYNTPLLCLLGFLTCTYILVKRHYLLKRTTAGLLKDRKT